MNNVNSIGRRATVKPKGTKGFDGVQITNFDDESDVFSLEKANAEANEKKAREAAKRTPSKPAMDILSTITAGVDSVFKPVHHSTSNSKTGPVSNGKTESSQNEASNAIDSQTNGNNMKNNRPNSTNKTVPNNTSSPTNSVRQKSMDVRNDTPTSNGYASPSDPLRSPGLPDMVSTSGFVSTRSTNSVLYGNGNNTRQTPRAKLNRNQKGFSHEEKDMILDDIEDF